MLFEKYTRDYTDYKTPKMSNLEFLDISAWEIAEMIRDYCNRWGNAFANDNEFISRFRSKDDKQHDSACFELLTYILFKNLGYTIEKHPFTGTTKRLDFGIQSPAGVKAYVECTLSSDSFESEQEKNHKKAILDIVEGISFFPFFINVNFRETSPVSISKKKFLAFINQQKTSLSNTPVSTITRKYLFENNGWQLELSFIRKPNVNTEKSMGFSTQQAKMISANKPILTALMDKKPSNYGITSDPYIICISSTDLFLSKGAISEALFGQYSHEKIDLKYPYKNGFLYAVGKPINTSAAAIIFFEQFNFFSLDAATITIWHNPFAKNPLPVNTLPFNEYVYENNSNHLQQVAIEKNNQLFQTLGIDREDYMNCKYKNKS